MTITIYAEKFSMAKIIAEALNEKGKVVNNKGYYTITYNGEEAFVTCGVGHLCELKQAVDYNADYKNWKNLPIPFIPEKFETKKKKEVASQTKIVADLFKKSDLIINATDFDREGELIFYYLYKTLNCKKPFKRVKLQSLTTSGIKDSFADLRDSKTVENITNAGRARSIADWLIGSNATVAMTLGFSERDVLSVGRVQTPTLNILVKKEKEIREFKPQKYWTLDAVFTTKTGETYTAKHKTEKFDNPADVSALHSKIVGKNGIVSSIDVKEEKRAVPYLFSLASLQMSCNSKFGYTLQQTLDVAQSLYEKGLITYPRTDSQYLTEDMEATVNSVLNALSKSNPEYEKLISGRARKFDKPHYFNDKKVSSHYAIIPTTKTPPSSLSKYESNVYDTVCRSVIMMLYGPASIKLTTVITDVAGEPFISKGSIISDPQWMLVGSTSKEEFLPSLNLKDVVEGSYDTSEKETKPPKRFTDKSLLKAMLNAGAELEDEDMRKILAVNGTRGGIGTEATRASIVETLIKRGFATREKKNLIPTEKGIRLIDAIPIEDIKSPVITGEWELRLSQIADGTEDFNKFIEDIKQLTIRWCKEITECSSSADSKVSTKTDSGNTTVSLSCPLCGKPLRKMNWGWGCSGYKEGCKFSVGSIAGKKLTDSQVKQLVEKGKTTEIKGFTSKAGKKFSAKLKLEDGRISFDF
jgi:DNA topoisomerase-3